MVDRPIPFTAPMVRALIGGTKTQTRRLMPHQDALSVAYSPIVSGGRIFNYAGEEEISRPRYAVGDRLWVKEAYRLAQHLNALPPTGCSPSHIWYEADGQCQIAGRPAPAEFMQDKRGKFRPSMFMRRNFSRLTLTVTEVRVERLQDISEADAEAEGIVRTQVNVAGSPSSAVWASPPGLPAPAFLTASSAYRDLWENINGPGSWEANPWVAAYTFEIQSRNIDATEHPNG